MPKLRSIEPTTFEDFCAIIQDGQKADLIDGVIYMASPDNTDANDIFIWLVSLMYDYVELFDLGKVFGSRVAFRLSNINSPEPDVAFVRKSRLEAIKRGHVLGPPDLALEIVSPDSVSRDYVAKRAQYEKFGVTEYWIVDEIEQKVTLLRLDAKGQYRVVRPIKGALTSKVIDGLWIRPEWCWPATRPKKAAALQEILSSK